MEIVRVILSLILVILAVLIFSILSVVGFFWSLFYLRFSGLSNYFFRIALSINQVGSLVFKGLFNDTLIKKSSGFKFGDEDTQISEVMGWNERYFGLTKIGKWLVALLDFLDKDHCEKTLFKEVEKSKNKVELFNKLENAKTRSTQSN